MNKKYTIWIILIILAIILAVILILNNKNSQDSQIANPASVYCTKHSGVSEIRTNSDGSQTGYCVFSDNTECEEWAFYSGECE
ncbi:MAG: DUF333 domain-containing protein [Candidatus Pacearchaeota archaeon]|nr:DUF333 domain-containing protein [Candidatus Pacearchaeota archaeon]